MTGLTNISNAKYFLILIFLDLVWSYFCLFNSFINDVISNIWYAIVVRETRVVHYLYTEKINRVHEHE